jgi:chemotaxis signal transduction protein
MTLEANTDSPSEQPRAYSALSLRFKLSSGDRSIPLHRLHHLAGYATLSGLPDDYFLGWLSMRGQPVPVFDLNRVVCDQPTPHTFGSRIMIVRAEPSSPTPYVGLLAAAITDTIATGAESVESLDLDNYLPMLYTLTPALPDRPAHA